MVLWEQARRRAAVLLIQERVLLLRYGVGQGDEALPHSYELLFNSRDSLRILRKMRL